VLATLEASKNVSGSKKQPPFLLHNYLLTNDPHAVLFQRYAIDVFDRGTFHVHQHRHHARRRHWLSDANLYAAFKFLIDKDAFSFIDLSELNPLKDQLRSEAPSGFYKGAAVKLVVQFKLQSGLGNVDTVDEKTANALNALLKKFGAFDAGTDFVVRGTVKDTHKRPQCGIVVIAVDRDLRCWQELGRTETDPDGKFEIPYQYESFCEAKGIVQAL
jgi:hypothetical protein